MIFLHPPRLALSLLLFLSTIVHSQQQQPQALSLINDEDPELPLSSPSLEPLLTSTLVDVLSSDADYTTLIHLLQRAKLIPTLNKLNGSTLFAPTNDAFQRAQQTEGGFWQGSFLLSNDNNLWDGDKKKKQKPDNILFELRQNLLYHLLNFTLPLPSSSSSSLFDSQHPQTLETLLFPSRYSAHTTPSPAPAPPWLPERERGGLLGFEGQRVRGIRREEEDWVGVDWKGEGGVKVLGMKEAANGVVVKVEDVLEKPRDVASTLLSHPSLTYLSSLLSPPSPPPPPHHFPLPSDPSNPIPPYSPLSGLRLSRNQTLFAPSNTAFAQLPKIERSYLESAFGREDVAWIVRMHAAAAVGGGEKDPKEEGQRVGWRETFVGVNGKKGEVRVGEGGRVWVEVDEESGEMSVGLVDDEGKEKRREGTKVVEPDVFCENGVIHIIDDLLIPEGAFKLTTEKTLIGLNATLFVTLLRSANLTSYIDSSSSSDSYTILAPLDSFLDPSSSSYNPNAFDPLSHFEGGDGIPRPGSKSLSDILKLHILPGRLRPKDLRDGALVQTESKLGSLREGRQVVKVGVKKVLGGLENEEEGAILVDWLREREEKSASLSSDEGDDDDRGGGGGPDQGEGEGSETWEQIQFNTVDVVSAPIEIGRSIIYLLSSFLEPPPDFVQTSAPDLRLSTFVAASFSSGVDRELKAAPGVTFFLPRNEAFRSLGLVMNYLLRSDAKEELRRVLKGHVVGEVLYGEDLEEKARKGAWDGRTLEGGKLVVRPGRKDGKVTVGGERRERDGEKWNGEWRDGEVVLEDMITSNGVIHQIDSVILPPSVDITLAKILKGSSNKIMAELLLKANLSWILNGTAPPEADLVRLGISGWLPPPPSTLSRLPFTNRPTTPPDDDQTSPNPPALSFPLSFTLLAPTDEAFSRINLTQYLLSPPLLLDLLKLHIIPSQSPLPLNPKTASKSTPVALPPPTDGRPLSLKEDVPYLTLLSASSAYGDLSFRQEGKGKFVVGIKGARGREEDERNDWAFVGGSGRASPRWGDEEEGSSSEEVEGEEKEGGVELVLNGVSRGGGVILISSVLVPFHPTWVMVWGWTVLAIIVGSIAALTAVGLVGFWLWSRRVEATTDYEPLSNEED
ncbi:hypothetical protein BDY24DRAFT_411530 [Mrakia frigida]|uniref:uncharacterized protein n=1 Tax=Mrakia frigida TaxID=29902 RepID=UPI003FCC06D7